MGLIEDDSFDEEECRALLARAQRGRIALTIRALPVIFPVRYALGGDKIFLSVDIDEVAARLRGVVIALQAEGYDEDSGRWWTALAIGPAQHIATLGEFSEARGPSSPPRADHETFLTAFPEVPRELLIHQRFGDRHIIVLEPEILSGRWAESL